MGSVKWPVVNGTAMRVTKLDSCGRVAFGEKARVSSDGFVSIAATADVDDGEEITVTNAQGVDCVKVPARPKIKGVTLVVTFCAVDPEMYSAVSGQAAIYDPVSGDAIGFVMDTAVRPSDVRFALESWSEVPGVVCSDDVTAQFGYLLWANCQGGVLGDYTLENGAVTFQMTNIKTLDGNGWGVGPYNVFHDADGDPAALPEALSPTEHFRAMLTDIAPPENSDGLIPLDDPDAAAATGATAGAPGSWTPADRNRPDMFAAMAGITASPTTAWTTGQSVVLEDGSRAYWDGDSWVEGVAP